MSDSAHSTRGTAARGNKDPGVGTGGGEKASSPAKKGKKVGKASTPKTPKKDPLEETPGMKAAEDSGEADQSADATEENSKPAAGAKEKDSQLAAGTTEVNSTSKLFSEIKVGRAAIFSLYPSGPERASSHHNCHVGLH